MVSPLSVTWLPWLQLLLLAAACFAFAANPKQLEGVIADFFSARMQRRYTEAAPSYVASISIALFRMGVLALALYLLVYAWVPGLSLSMAVYGIAVGLVLLVYAIRYVLQELVQYVFMLGNTFSIAYNHQRRIDICLSLVLYAFLLFQHWLTPRGLIIGLILIAAVYALLLFVRAGRTYLVRPLAALYIVIYIATLDFLPALVMIAGIYQVALHV